MECCGKCRHNKMKYEYQASNKKRIYKGWVCDNKNSECYGLETEYKEHCVDFEERD